MRKIKYYGVDDGYIIRGRRVQTIEDFSDKYTLPIVFNGLMLLTIPGDMLRNSAAFFVLVMSTWYALGTRFAATSRDNSDNVKINDRAVYYELMKRYWLAYTFPLVMIYLGLNVSAMGMMSEGVFFTSIGFSSYSALILNAIMIRIRKSLRN